jgi:hypothetical protein
MWLSRCVLIVPVLGATSAMYVFVRDMWEGAEPPTWRQFSAAARSVRANHRTYSAFSSVATISATILLVGAVRHPGLLAGLFFGWACVLMTPVFVFALASQRVRSGTTNAVAVGRGDLSAVSPHRALVAAVLHVIALIVVLCLPHQVCVIALSLCGALPAMLFTAAASQPAGSAQHPAPNPKRHLVSPYNRSIQ